MKFGTLQVYLSIKMSKTCIEVYLDDFNLLHGRQIFLKYLHTYSRRIRGVNRLYQHFVLEAWQRNYVLWLNLARNRWPESYSIVRIKRKFSFKHLKIYIKVKFCYVLLPVSKNLKEDACFLEMCCGKRVDYLHTNHQCWLCCNWKTRFRNTIWRSWSITLALSFEN